MNGATSDQLITALAEQDFTVAADLLGAADPFDARMFLERLDLNERAIAFRLLEKNRALAVFEGFSPSLQRELVGALGEADVDVNPRFGHWDGDNFALVPVTPEYLTTEIVETDESVSF